MKFFSTLFFLSFFALAFCAAVSKPEMEEYEVAKREVAVSNAKYVPATLPNGKKSISVYNGDVLEGSLVEGDNGEIIVHDAFGNVIDLDNLEDDESGGKRKRQSRFTILRIFYKFIVKYGRRAWDFLYCIGFEVAFKCADNILHCATQGIPPWNCLDGIVCSGLAFRRCV